jgi:hypothetical protein
MKKLLITSIIVAIVVTMQSCSKSSDAYTGETIEGYYPLQTGKYITYQLDSLVYLAFGTRDTTISYQVKYEVDSLLTDTQGRPSYRIFRYIRKTASNAWSPDATFMATNTGNAIEFVENNLRFIKLTNPVTNTHSWKGNAYINTSSPSLGLQYMGDWDYTYENVGASETIGVNTLENVVTVNHRDEEIGVPGDPSSYSEVNFSQEKYAKGIGMVYRKFFHSEFQPGGGGYFAEGSYGVTLTMLERN